jgi:hypothetical protein
MSLPVKTTQISLFDFDDSLSTSTFVIDDDEDYETLCKFVKAYVDADCRALTINDQVIFNSYNNLSGFQGQILEDILRDQIIKSPHRSLFLPLHRTKKEGVIRIYMMEEPHLQIIEIHFDPKRMAYYPVIYNGKF